MFKGLAADISGSADVCKCIPKDRFNTEESMNYLLPGEVPYILLKSKKEEHLFTNMGYIVMNGANGTTTRRLITRFDYFDNRISGVLFETAGMGITDRDVELKFNIGQIRITIDIWKNEIQTALLYYKVLLAIAHHQGKNAHLMELAKLSAKANKTNEQSDENLLWSFKWAEHCLQAYAPVSYSFIFDMFLPLK